MTVGDIGTKIKIAIIFLRRNKKWLFGSVVIVDMKKKPVVNLVNALNVAKKILLVKKKAVSFI